MSREKRFLPTLDDIDELVAFLPKLYAEGFEAQKEIGLLLERLSELRKGLV